MRLFSFWCYFANHRERRRGRVVLQFIASHPELDAMVRSQALFLKTIESTGCTLPTSICLSVIWRQQECPLTLRLESYGTNTDVAGVILCLLPSMAWPQEGQPRTWEKQDFPSKSMPSGRLTFPNGLFRRTWLAHGGRNLQPCLHS